MIDIINFDSRQQRRKVLGWMPFKMEGKLMPLLSSFVMVCHCFLKAKKHNEFHSNLFSFSEKAHAIWMLNVIKNYFPVRDPDAAISQWPPAPRTVALRGLLAHDSMRTRHVRVLQQQLAERHQSAPVLLVGPVEPAEARGQPAHQGRVWRRRRGQRRTLGRPLGVELVPQPAPQAGATQTAAHERLQAAGAALVALRLRAPAALLLSALDGLLAPLGAAVAAESHLRPAPELALEAVHDAESGADSADHQSVSTPPPPGPT